MGLPLLAAYLAAQKTTEAARLLLASLVLPEPPDLAQVAEAVERLGQLPAKQRSALRAQLDKSFSKGCAVPAGTPLSAYSAIAASIFKLAPEARRVTQSESLARLDGMLGPGGLAALSFFVALLPEGNATRLRQSLHPQALAQLHFVKPTSLDMFIPVGLLCHLVERGLIRYENALALLGEDQPDLPWAPMAHELCFCLGLFQVQGFTPGQPSAN